MKRIFGKIFSSLLFCLFCLYAVAQNSYDITLPFACGFEDTLVENHNWIIKAGVNAEKCGDQWMIGNLDYREGYNSLYLSSDTGKTMTFGVKPNCVIAYRPIVIPKPSAVQNPRCKVNISFAYKGGAERENLANLYYCFVPDFDDIENYLKSNSYSAVIPPELSSDVIKLPGIKTWAYKSFNQNMTFDEKYYLVFIWQNSNVDSSFMDLSACIDDIQIVSNNCPQLDFLNVKTYSDTLVITWEGMHQSFDLEYRLPGMTTWQKKHNLEFDLDSPKVVVLPSLPEGLYDVRVRGVCGNGEKSAWKTEGDIVVFCADRHCINYVKLDNNPDVFCLIGHATDPSRGANSTLKPTGIGENGFDANPIDHGSKDIRSRHTVNWKQNEYDPRTGNGLRTIPEGALASVRLGNWSGGALAEGIRYKFTVDTAKAKIVLMRYAVVLEAPGHGIKQDPYFMLVLKDANGELIKEGCGDFSFTPENQNIKWERFSGYVWKDWTSIGVNVSEYHGQEIYIELITQDCLMSAHGGYAYFTLDCADAAIKSTSCGDDIFMTMEAPDGFRYAWTARENPDSVLSTEKIFKVPSHDTATYYCTLNYWEIDGCDFQFYTQVKPRLPHAEFEWEWKPQNCQNRLVLKNKSCVYTRVDSVDTPTSEPCETFWWDVNNGEFESNEENFVVHVPKEGAEFTVTLIAAISGGCEDTITIPSIKIPAIRDTITYVSKQQCFGVPEFFGGQYIITDGVYTAQDTTWCGCDSSTVMDLKFRPEIKDTYDSITVCGDQPFFYNGYKFTESCDTTLFLKSVDDCDSAVILHLVVVDPFGVSVDDSYHFACADEDKLMFDFDSVANLRLPVNYSILFGSLEKQNGFIDQENIVLDPTKTIIDILIPDSCRPNTYSATLLFKDTTSVCGDISVPISFDVYYSSDILQPKFGNLITVLDETENGGYEFVEGEYKWYKNDQLVDTVVNAFYYLSNGVTFNGEDCFYMIPKRKDDGVAIRTCKICPGEGTPIVDVYDSEELIQTTVLERGGLVLLNGVDDAVVNIYSFTGLLISSHSVNANNSYIVAPTDTGFYIAQIKTKDRSYVYKIWVK